MLITVFIITLTYSQVFCQKNQNDLEIKEQYKKAPLLISRSTIKLAKYLTKNDSSDSQKTLNIYTWIIHNIKYDFKALNKIKSKKYNAKQTLRRRKGICYQYSNLFNTLCQNSGVSSREIVGYSKGSSYFEDDKFFEADHSWNGVKVDSSWVLVDATWGSGLLYPKKQRLKRLMYQWFKKPYIKSKFKFVRRPNYEYFKAQPEFLIKNHLPVDPSWQLLKYPISLNTFESNNWGVYQNNIDSIYLRVVDSLEYSKKLNKYDFLSNNQFIDITASKANSFNSKNYQLLSSASFINAPLNHTYTSNYESIIKNNKESIKNYKSTISLARKHQNIVSFESKKNLQNILKRINYEVSKISQKRTKSTRYQHSKSINVLKTRDKVLDNYVTQISNLQKTVVNYKPKVLNLKLYTNKSKPDLVEKNKIKLIQGFDKITSSEDMIGKLNSKIKDWISKKAPCQFALNFSNKTLSQKISANSILINSNLQFSYLAISMSEIDSIGIKIDSLNKLQRRINDSVTFISRKLKRLNSLIIAQSRLNQKMLFDNCRFSKGSSCDSLAYLESSSSIGRSNKRKLEAQKQIYETKKSDYDYHQNIFDMLQKQSDYLNINVEFISLYKEWRTSGINFNKIKSTYQMDEIISESNRKIGSLILANNKLKHIILVQKRKG